jgi:phosphate starvation-inducible membrane PsiE
MTAQHKKTFLPLVLLFVMVNSIAIVFKPFMVSHQIDIGVIIASNSLLFLIAVLSLNMQLKSVKNPNPHAMVRGVMGSVVLKLFVLGTAAFIYLYAAGESKSVNALFISMALYLLYTWLEVRLALRLNPPKNGSN